MELKRKSAALIEKIKTASRKASISSSSSYSDASSSAFEDVDGERKRGGRKRTSVDGDDNGNDCDSHRNDESVDDMKPAVMNPQVHDHKLHSKRFSITNFIVVVIFLSIPVRLVVDYFDDRIVSDASIVAC